ncbi:MAG: hypothetical protein LBP59_00455 [Planctomycetaceae bacterium]|nr:hypothetical protein [Planctomycetaceae bacterium]
MRLYSIANERGLYSNSLFVCIAATCSRYGCDPSAELVTFLNFLFALKNCPSCPSKNCQ